MNQNQKTFTENTLNYIASLTAKEVVWTAFTLLAVAFGENSPFAPVTRKRDKLFGAMLWTNPLRAANEAFLEAIKDDLTNMDAGGETTSILIGWLALAIAKARKGDLEEAQQCLDNAIVEGELPVEEIRLGLTPMPIIFRD
jgi:hypothetical protein